MSRPLGQEDPGEKGIAATPKVVLPENTGTEEPNTTVHQVREFLSEMTGHTQAV